MEINGILDVDKYSKELKEDLYYDILEKYVLLKAENKKLESYNRQLKIENLYFRNSGLNVEELSKIHNKTMDRFIRLSYKHKAPKEFIEELKLLKTKVFSDIENNS